ncbi:MAG: type II toxin-antitoxin system CcdA family antitoxin [Candidatus Bathyarchaeia archaeon]
MHSEDIFREAKELGLNVSKICENALKTAIEQLRPLYGKTEAKNCEKCGGWDSNPPQHGDFSRASPLFLF